MEFSSALVVAKPLPGGGGGTAGAPAVDLEKKMQKAVVRYGSKRFPGASDANLERLWN